MPHYGVRNSFCIRLHDVDVDVERDSARHSEYFTILAVVWLVGNRQAAAFLHSRHYEYNAKDRAPVEGSLAGGGGGGSGHSTGTLNTFVIMYIVHDSDSYSVEFRR